MPFLQFLPRETKINRNWLICKIVIKDKQNAAAPIKSLCCTFPHQQPFLPHTNFSFDGIWWLVSSSTAWSLIVSATLSGAAFFPPWNKFLNRERSPGITAMIWAFLKGDPGPWQAVIESLQKPLCDLCFSDRWQHILKQVVCARISFVLTAEYLCRISRISTFLKSVKV